MDELDLGGGSSFGFDLTVGDPDLSLGWMTDSSVSPYLDASWLGSLGSMADLSNLNLGGLSISDVLAAAKKLMANPATATAGATGLAALMNSLNKGSGSAPTGYQGGIPYYTASREQTPAPAYKPYAQFDRAATGTYRPGQGGISYFTPMKYASTGFVPKTAEEFLTGPATGTTTPAAETTTPADAANTTNPVLPETVSTEPLKDDGTPRAYANGGIAMLAKGGRYIKGPGDGVSDSVPAVIESARGGQPAKLADGEFVFPARVVAEIGNGSNEAGARKLYALLDKIEARAKGAKRGKPSGADKELNKLA